MCLQKYRFEEKESQTKVSMKNVSRLSNTKLFSS